ncbi:DAO-domain-containing protein [Podospora aff. communis PSN243]|uniref:DAO-domain-containing protein n=1 Tax=Podospora aff. communis PSN243 TaxID=3040156 RepID=A0AAV9GUW3_9PEZI|nr:DAO-domain-containing protein [Podospora aff. communis PSN243]
MTLSSGQAGLPSPNPSKSYWLQDPSTTLLGHHSTPDLPQTADIVIVGSGITGAFATHFLKKGLNENGLGQRAGESVVLLEAREACFGATGRNGGHCQPFVYGNAPSVAAFELANYHFIRDLVKKEDIPCDWVDVTGVHAYLTPALFDAAAATAKRLKVSHPDIAKGLEVVQPTDTKRLAELRVPNAAGVIVQQHAASLWPYKLVAHILESLLHTFPPSEFNLQANTPVTSLTQLRSLVESDLKWQITTPRGTILANQVLLATNGYTSHLIPDMSDLIVPVRGQIAALLPTRNQPPPQLNHSYVFASQQSSTTPWRDDYLVQRPLDSVKGEFIFGGGRGFARNKGLDEWRDDEVEPEVSRFLKANLCPPLDLGASGEASPLAAEYEWTGIMGYSRDLHPWVGAVPGSVGGGEGLFVSAGYTGHGMPNAVLSARGVVEMMRGMGRGESGVEYMVPEKYVLSEERVGRVRSGDTVGEAQAKDLWLEAFPDLRPVAEEEGTRAR